jgi:hypothetical protein
MDALNPILPGDGVEILLRAVGAECLAKLDGGHGALHLAEKCFHLAFS